MKNPKEKANDIFDINYSLATELNPMASIEIRKIYALKISVKSVDEIIASSPSLPILADNGSYGSDISLSTEWWKKVFKELNKRLHKSIGRP
jgi:hypothetical protein